MNSDISREKTKFLDHELMILVFGGAFQRAKIYEIDVPEKDRSIFRHDICKELAGIIGKYRQEVSGEQHRNNIKALSEKLTKHYYSILDKQKLRLGVTQKILNLYLKFMWCRGELSTPPPSCPYDNKVLKELNRNDKWTQVDEVEILRGWDLLAHEKAHNNGYESIAEWELMFFNSRRKEH